MEIENDQEKEKQNEQEQKIPFSLQGEMNLVNEEEEENKNGPTQKERLEKMLDKLNKDDNQNEEKNENEENPNNTQENPKVVLRGVKKVLGKADTNSNTTKTTKLNVKKSIPEPFDMTFDLEEHYFYKTIPKEEWDEINSVLEEYLAKDSPDESELKNIFNSHPNIKKGNVEALLENIKSLHSDNFSTYQSLIKFILNEYYQPKPTICECHFFPNTSNEEKVVSMLRTCKKTLDISIFSLTLDSIAEAILEAYQRGIKVRVIADDECAKNKGSNIKVIASVGVPCKTDNAIYHMHNKFAVIDNSVVIMGSFNWTGQAVKYNQENVFFYEDKNIANQYSQEFEKLWNNFNTVVDQKEAKKAVEEEAKEEEAKKKAKAEKQKVNEDKKANSKNVKEQKIEKSESKKATKTRVRGVKNK